MDDGVRRLARRRIASTAGRAWRAGLVAALAACLAGCVGMPNSGSPGTFSATPQDTTQGSEFIGAIPAGPGPNWTPSQIVQGFLNASASYPLYKDIAWQYLTSNAIKSWAPTWSVTVVDQVNVPKNADVFRDGKQATVDVTGGIRASFNGTGQYVGAQQSSNGTQANQLFDLVKVDGQWRITNPPNYRVLNQPDFSEVYKPQDLYFFDSTQQVLVPDSVFVPSSGTSPQSLVTNLVQALLSDPQPPWLQKGTSHTPPAITEIPGGPGVTKVGVTIDGTTATVDLTGPAVASATNTTLGQISAQLVWTLTAAGAGPPNIQAVQLEVNGKLWTPSSAPCPGQSASPAQKQAMYNCKDPYPPATSPAFYYVGNGQAWSRCASVSQVMTGSIGAALPLFSKTSAATLNQSCGTSVQAQSKPVLPPQPRGVPLLSMVAVSPDGKYAAGVTPDRKSVVLWVAGGTRPSSTLTLPGVIAIGWDRKNYLWVTQQNANTTMVVPASDGSDQGAIPNSFGGKILGLSIAPDGVRVAAITSTAFGPQIQLAAINRNSSNNDETTGPLGSTSIGPTVQLGPNVPDPIALTWYDADHLLVLDDSAGGATLWEVPVDGQPAIKYPGVPPNAVSITANSATNALVVGRSDNQLEVSASLAGPWQPLGSGGQNPAFPVPVFPASGQS